MFKKKILIVVAFLHVDDLPSSGTVETFPAGEETTRISESPSAGCSL